MVITVNSQGLAGENLDLVAVFLALWGEVNHLAGETSFGFGKRCNVFEFRRVNNGR
ncbi:hypothetical protein D3C84_1144420 [compost metagenome]